MFRDKCNVYSLSHVWLFFDPMDCGPPGSSVHGISQARNPVPFPSPDVRMGNGEAQLKLESPFCPP